MMYLKFIAVGTQALMTALSSQFNLRQSLIMMQDPITDTFSVKWNTSAQEEKGKNLSISIILYSDGPALRVNKTLDQGQSNQCPTFNSPILTLGKKNVDDIFVIHNLELFIL